MTKKAMPDWMMQYVANIGNDECYKKFLDLSNKYHTEMESGGTPASPTLRYDMDKTRRVTKEAKPHVPKSDREEFDITEKYKGKASLSAIEYGYERLKYEEVLDKTTREMRENNPQDQFISYEDPIAKKAHSIYQEKYPEKAQKFQENIKKYRTKELKEIDLKEYREHYTQEFDKAQDRFENTRQSESEKIQNTKEKFQQNAKDITAPDPANPSNPDAKNSRQMDEPEPDPNNGNSGGAKNASKEADKSDTTKYNISSRFFTSLGIDQNKLEQLSNKSTKQDKEIDTEKKSPSERYFQDIGFTINKSDITKNPNNDKSSISYSFNKASTKSTDRSVDLEKD